MATELDHPESTNPARAEFFVMRGAEVIRSFDHRGRLVAPNYYTDAQAEAYRAGYAAMSSCAEPADTMEVFNPHTDDGAEDLYEAWQAGADSAD